MLKNGTIFEERYRIESSLGAGGFGAVYKADETMLNRMVAIKLMFVWADKGVLPDSLNRFQREAQVLCQMSNPNILQVYRFGVSDSQIPFLVMEYFEGESLRALIARNGALEYKLAIEIAKKLAEALRYSHKQGIIHRDLKPENVLIRLTDNNTPLVKLIDFGLCKPDFKSSNGMATLTETGELLGSPAYMSPEQALGQKVDKRTDVYSFALILYELITGSTAHSAGSPSELLIKRISMQVPEILKQNPKCGLPPQIDSLIQRCSRLRIEDRVTDFDVVLEDLHALEASVPPGKFSSRSHSEGPSQKTLFKVLISLVILILLGIAARPLYTILVPVETPAEVQHKTFVSISDLIQKHDLRKAATLAKAFMESDGVSQATLLEKANLYFSYFQLFRATPDKKTADFFLLSFLKAIVPTLKGNAPLSAEMMTKLNQVYEYAMGKEKMNRQTWMAIRNLLQDLDWTQKPAEAGLLVHELATEALLNSWQNPSPEVIVVYLKELGGMVVTASAQDNEAEYNRYVRNALTTARNAGVKRAEAYILGQMAKHELKKNKLTEAVSYMQACKKVLEEIRNSNDAQELKLSSRVDIFKIEAEIHKKLEEQCVKKGDLKEARKHAEISRNLISESKSMTKEALEEEEALRSTLVPSIPVH